ncbi:hypothetical protein O181_125078 [Austropuccinia psidii MF-1]|uniref:Reverse transcriptase/retrotransposon-derived protein RNase H-like domain-containing protein n=1 Tax=Austropuccinia psidii MF-1 TaxID=1389203 RepID=A0A9Q3Q4Q0_9BASI|nr:hypothetical protein [Austropuccinia psidii MF-1]
MVFSKYEEEHVAHVSTVLSRLRANNLFSKASKCIFHILVWNIWVILFLLKASRWTKKRSSRFSIGHLQETSSLFNLYLDFPIATALSSRIIQRKSVHSPVSSRRIPVFPSMRKLSVSFTTAQIPSHFNPSLPTIVETVTSNYALGAVLSQVSDSGKHPIAFDSCKLITAELNYEINDKELLCIVWALKCWRAFLLSLS